MASCGPFANILTQAMHKNILIGSAVAMATYWCILLLGFSALLLSTDISIVTEEDEKKPVRITSIHLLCAMNLNFGLLSVFCQEKKLNIKFLQIRPF